MKLLWSSQEVNLLRINTLWFVAMVLLFSQVESKTSAVVDQPAAASSVRSIDFANFTYPWTEGLRDPHRGRQTFSLKNGELPATRDAEGRVDGMGVYLSHVDYQDVTGDWREDAIIVMSILTGGSALPNLVYIYQWRANKPHLLWTFDTGDRADGGLRRIKAESGSLTIELYGKGKLVGSNYYKADGMTGGACCPTHFTRTHYKWNGRRFVRKGKSEILQNPEGHGSPVMNYS